MRIEEVLEGFVATSRHTRKLSALERVHGYTADEGDMNTEAAVNARA